MELSNNSDRSICMEEVPGLVKVNKVKPKTTKEKENVQVTQVHGSMEKKQILEKVADIKK